MFLLATMLITVYIVAMANILINFKTEQIDFERESLRETYLDSKREIQHYLELILSKYTKNNSVISKNIAIEMIYTFLHNFEIMNTARGITSEFQFNSEDFFIISNQHPYENTSEGNIYTSSIGGNFTLRLNSVSSAMTIIESFKIYFLARAEIKGNNIIIQQSKGNQLTYIEASTIYILNGSTQLNPIPNPDQTGIYYFEGLPSLENLGILNVTLPNGVSVLS
ncbi:MAG: hypothetical protein ACFFAJ_10425 [Candidatus Hodarchaeota archaeon]